MPNFDGDSSNNVLIGTSGADSLRGFGGHDILDGNGGADTMRGGEGDDIYITDGGDTLVESANQGVDEVRASVTTVLGTNFENLTLTGSAHINGSGNAVDNVMTGNAGYNVLNGRGGIDTFQMTRAASYTGVTTADLGSGTATGHGNDMLFNIENVRGTSGRDHIWGSSGNNLIDGGDGDDLVYAGPGQDVLLGGNGSDELRFQNGGAVNLNLTQGTYSVTQGGAGSLAGFERMIGSPHDDHMTGDADANLLSGANGSDVLIGGGGDDELWGGMGSDRLVADQGNDRLIGHSQFGATLAGGTSDGAGNVFEVQPTAGMVTVADFHARLDKIDLSGFGLGNPGSPWTASGSYSGANTVLQLSNGQGQQVNILLEGVDASDQLSLGDFIGGTATLLPVVPPPPPPIGSVGNGLADVFVVVPQNVIANHNGELNILGFEDNLDLLDLSFFANYPVDHWSAELRLDGHSGPDLTRLEFSGQGGEFFAVNLVGFNVNHFGYDDLIM